MFFLKESTKNKELDDPSKPTKSASEIATELKVFFVYNKNRYLTDMFLKEDLRR